MYGSRTLIWLQTLAVMTGYAAAIAVVHRLVLRTSLGSRALALAIAFATVQIAAIVVMLIVLLTRRGLAGRRTQRSRELAAAARAAVAEHAAGMDRLRVLRDLQRRSRRDVAGAVASFVTATRGTMQERTTTLARVLGLSARELAEEGTVERAAGASLLDRALLADEMQPRAEQIARLEIPEALIARDERRAVAALDLLLSWRRVLAVRGVEYALIHESDEVRSRAFRVIPYVQPSHAERIPPALRDPSPRVRAAAAEAAGRLRLEMAIPALAHALRDEDGEVARSAAFALATMPGGVAMLQQSESRAAFEALEKATLGRLEVA